MNTTADNLTKFQRQDWNTVRIFRHGEHLGFIGMRVGRKSNPDYDEVFPENYTVHLIHMDCGKLPGEERAHVFASLKEAKKFAKQHAEDAFQYHLEYLRKYQPSEYKRVRALAS